MMLLLEQSVLRVPGTLNRFRNDLAILKHITFSQTHSNQFLTAETVQIWLPLVVPFH
jgi:hypothetical protein